MSRRIANVLEAARAVERCYQRMLFGLVPLLAFYGLCQVFAGSDVFYERVNGSAPVYMICTLLWPVYRLVRGVPEAIWAPVAWLPISFAVFYGFGPMVTVYGNDATLWHMMATPLAVSQADVFRANLLSTIGVALVIAGFFVNERFRLRRLRRGAGTSYPYLKIKPATLALIFIVVGGTLKHGVLKPAEWSETTIVVPGAISALGPLVDVGYGLLAFSMTASRQQKLRFAFWATWPLHVFLSTLSLAKAEVITAMLLPSLGAFMAHRIRKRFAVSMGAMALAFALTQPWVQFGRGVIEAQTGTISQASYSERIDLLTRYMSGERTGGARRDDVQSWWTRLNFSGVQAYAMHAYENGDPGSTLENAWMYFIPRVVWVEKPVMEGPGRAFHAMVTGGEGTSFLALSVFGDLYWQFGWLGVIVVCPLIGLLFSSWSWRSIEIMHARQFIMLPVVLLALDSALLGMNRYLANGIIGVVPMYYGYLAVTRLATHVLSSGRRGVSGLRPLTRDA